MQLDEQEDVGWSTSQEHSVFFYRDHNGHQYGDSFSG